MRRLRVGAAIAMVTRRFGRRGTLITHRHVVMDPVLGHTQSQTVETPVWCLPLRPVSWRQRVGATVGTVALLVVAPARTSRGDDLRIGPGTILSLDGDDDIIDLGTVDELQLPTGDVLAWGVQGTRRPRRRGPVAVP